jgi:hypothetical protein
VGERGLREWVMGDDGVVFPPNNDRMFSFFFFSIAPGNLKPNLPLIRFCFFRFFKVVLFYVRGAEVGCVCVMVVFQEVGW